MDWKLILITTALPVTKWLLRGISKLSAAMALYIEQLEASYAKLALKGTPPTAKVQAPSGMGGSNVVGGQTSKEDTNGKQSGT